MECGGDSVLLAPWQSHSHDTAASAYCVPSSTLPAAWQSTMADHIVQTEITRISDVEYVNGDVIDQWCKQKRTSSTMMYTDLQGSSRSKGISTARCHFDAAKGSPSDVEFSSVCCCYQSSRTRETKAQEIYVPSLDRIQDSMNGGNLLGRSDTYEGYIN